MRKKSIAYVALAFVCVLALAACGGSVPSYIMTPPTDPTELEQKLRDEGFRSILNSSGDNLNFALNIYRHMFSTEIPREELIAVVQGERGFDFREETPRAGTRVTVESVFVFYFASTDFATEWFDEEAPKFSARRASTPAPDHIRNEYSFTRFENVVSLWQRSRFRIQEGA